MHAVDAFRALRWGASVRSGDTGHGQVWDDGPVLVGTLSRRQVKRLRENPAVDEKILGTPGFERRVLTRRLG